jgi:hypothetical protein
MSEIPPKSEWQSLSLMQLYDTKTKLTNLYFDMVYSKASFAAQYRKFISEVDSLILAKERELQQTS